MRRARRNLNYLTFFVISVKIYDYRYIWIIYIWINQQISSAYLNNAKCENMIGWPLKFEPISPTPFVSFKSADFVR